jgi:hypothetical protein
VEELNKVAEEHEAGSLLSHFLSKDRKALSRRKRRSLVWIKVDCWSGFGDCLKVLFPSGLEVACHEHDLLGIFSENWTNGLGSKLIKLKVLIGGNDFLDRKGLAEEESLLDTVSEASGDLDQDTISLVTAEGKG